MLFSAEKVFPELCPLNTKKLIIPYTYNVNQT